MNKVMMDNTPVKMLDKPSQLTTLGKHHMGAVARVKNTGLRGFVRGGSDKSVQLTGIDHAEFFGEVYQASEIEIIGNVCW